MANEKRRIDITSADSKQLGFDYQYLYFLVKLLQLSKGEEVGYESLDDIHTISSHDQKTYFYQLKHTILKTASETQPNLVALSKDLWKTISNWSKLILDPLEGRELVTSQKDFINKSKFVFVANRNITKNIVIDQMQRLKAGKIKRKEFIDTIKYLYTKTVDIDIKNNIKSFLSLSGPVMELFVTQIEFINSPDDLFELIREGIRGKMIPEEYVDDVLSSLFLQLKEDFFNNVADGKHQVITYQDWIEKYQRTFNQYRTTQLPLRKFNYILPDHLEKQKFVQELIEIGAIDLSTYGIAEIAELTDHYLQIRMHLDAWHDDGRITKAELQRFHGEAILLWKNVHRQNHRTTHDTSQDFKNALACFDMIMSQRLSLLSTELGISLSNGEFINLAEEEKIGWKISWKERYFDGTI